MLSTPQPGPGPMLFMPKRNVNTKEVDARLFERLRNMAEYYDVHLIIITSGYRTHEAHRNLYYGYMDTLREKKDIIMRCLQKQVGMSTEEQLILVAQFYKD